jgi:hypothetical protein
MSDDLGNFLVDVALNSDLQARVSADLPGELARRSLTPHEQEALLTRDSRRVAKALDASPTPGLGVTVKPKKKRKRPASKKRPPKAPRRKKTKR